MAMILVLTVFAQPSFAYIEAAYSLGQMVRDSSNILLIKVESVDREKNTISYSKVADIKGTHPRDDMKHNIAKAGFTANEWQNVMNWAAEGKLAVMCYAGTAAEVCIDNYWYQVYAAAGVAGEWWNMIHAEPYLLRSFAGKPEKLVPAVKAMLNNEEVIVTCMVDGDKNALALRMGRIQKMRASLKLLNYDAARDFAGWGGDDIKPILDMPAFERMGVLPTLPSGSGWGVATGNMESRNRTDIAIFNADRVVILKNEGEGSFDPVELKGFTGGARAAAWATYNGVGAWRNSLALATPEGVKLLTNMGNGIFRDDSAALPTWGYSGATAVAWLWPHGSLPPGGPEALRPTLLVADQFAGLRVLKNETPLMGEDKAGGGVPEAKFVDVSDEMGFGAKGLASGLKVAELIQADLLGKGGTQILVNGADGRLVVLVLDIHTRKFEELKTTGLTLRGPSKLIVQDIDGDKKKDIIAVSANGTSVFKNLGNGKFKDITQQSGLAGVSGTSAAFVWMSPKANSPDLLVGGIRGSNRFFRNDGRGRFTETSTEVGLDRRIFNTRAVAILTTTGVGASDLVMVNEGQPSCVLLWKK
ncbi:MAG: VCBS repeat-containing protein [Phycisphaerales bacterium]|nr:VCBS repeat-containing protein [Phycisphaerales bacterium]